MPHISALPGRLLDRTARIGEPRAETRQFPRAYPSQPREPSSLRGGPTTSKTNARIAGVAFLLYIALGITAMVLSAKASSPETAQRLALLSQHATAVRIAAVLSLLASFCALFVGVALYALTREVDRDLALLALAFRVGEGVIGGTSISRLLGMLWLATEGGASEQTLHAAQALVALGQEGPAAMFFAVGSLLFCWLLLRGRMIPVWLAWLGLVASILWVVGLPLQMAGVLSRTVVMYALWIPMAAFEIPFALWLVFKGVTMPSRMMPLADK